MSVRIYLSGNPVHDYVLLALHDQIPSEICDSYEISDVAVVFGVYKGAVKQSYFRGSVIAQQRIHGKKTVVIDSGYVHRGNEKDSYYSCGLNDINGYGSHGNVDCPPDRWEALGVELKPWHEDGHLLLCGQVPWDASVQRINYLEWLYAMAERMRKFTHRETIFRPHPLAGHPTHLPGLQTSTARDIEEDLEGAYAVVAYNSNSLVDGVINGVAAAALGHGHMVEGVSVNGISPDVLDVPRPDRAQWANDLAYAQWRPDEIGQAFERVIK